MRDLYKGNIKSDLENTFVERLGKLNRHPLDETIVLVPSTMMAKHLRNLILNKFGGFAGIRFHTFESLARPHIDAALSSRSLKPLPPQASGILLKRAVLNTLKEGDALFRLRDTKGLAGAIWSTIRDLKEARISVGDLIEAADKMPDRAKIEEIARIWDTYERKKTELKYCDDKDQLRIALDDLSRRPPKLETPFFIFGVYDATHLQKELIKAYVENNDAIAFLPWNEEEINFLGPFEYFLQSAGFREIASKPEERPANSIDILQLRLFANKTFSDPMPSPDEVEFISGAGEIHEAREVVSRLVAYCFAHDIAFDEAAILLRNPDEYVSTFQEIFSASGIPYTTAKGEALISTPAGRALNSLVNLISQADRSFDNFEEFIDSAPLKIGGKEIWTRLAREAGVINLPGKWPLIIENYKKELEYYSRDADLTSLKSLISFTTLLFRELDEIARPGQWQEVIRKIKSCFTARIDGGTRGFSETLSLMDRLELFSDAVGKCDIDEIVEIVTEELRSATIKYGDEADYGITICDVMHSRGAPFRVVAIPGLTRGIFPAPYREDPLLLDEERELLAKLLPDKCPPDFKKIRSVEERFLFRSAVGSAYEKLFLSYSRSEPIGERPKYPSSFFIESLEAFNNRPVSEKDIAELSRKYPPFPIYPKRLDDALNKIEAISWIAATQPEALTFDIFFTRGVEAMRQRFDNGYSSYDGLISDKSLVAEFIAKFKIGDEWTLSPSRLEKYARCPFSFFLNFALDIEPAEEIEEEDEITAMDVGEMYHRILAQLYRKIRDDGDMPLSRERFEDYAAIISEITTAEFDAIEGAGTIVGRGIMRDVMKNQVIDNIAAVVLRDIEDTEWAPSYFEVSTSPRKDSRCTDDKLGTHEPISIDLGEDIRFKLKCVIDRIDVSTDGSSARIFDYKTGAGNSFKKNSLDGGKQIQVPLYCLAAKKLLEARKIEVVQGSYWFISREKTKRKGAKIVPVGESIELLPETIKLMLNCLENGLFHQYSDVEGKRSPCRSYCNFARACIEFPDAVKARKISDSIMEKWNELKEK